jgi:hypothetical protein
MKNFLGMACLATAFALPSVGFADVYVCKIKPKEDVYWMPTDLIIEYDPSTASVLILDQIIQDHKGKKHKGKLKADNAKRVSFSWVLKGLVSSRNQFVPEFKYSASFIKKKGFMNVTATPTGYGNVFTGRGKCKIGK